MKIVYDKEALRSIVADISTLTDLTISVLDVEYNSLVGSQEKDGFCSLIQKYAANKELCAACDKKLLETCRKSNKLEFHLCHAGLYDFAMPIQKDGIIVGYILMGRVRSVGSPCKSTYNYGNCAELYEKTTLLSPEQITALSQLMPLILFNTAIKIERAPFVDEIEEYIKLNPQSALSVNEICKKFHISKNFLYKSFYDEFGKTVNEYVTDMRIDLAKSLLSETSDPVYSVAEQVGISNYTYFCKLFKRHTGHTANEYRAINKSDKRSK